VIATIAFYALALLALVSGVVVIRHRNPVVGALFLVVTLGAVAGLFFLMGAHFIGVMQILVYAGAIVVLIIFMIMLLNLPREEGLPTGKVQGALAVVLGLLVLGFLVRAVLAYRPEVSAGFLTEVPEGYGLVSQVSAGLFGPYFFAFEAISLVLIVAMAGAILFAKRDL
jgi:NADH-quinone oxidoreductase subunit J